MRGEERPSALMRGSCLPRAREGLHRKRVALLAEDAGTEPLLTAAIA